MILGAISSTDKKDLRSAIHPDTIKYLLDMGIEVIFESGAGDGISATDSKFEKIGAKSKSRHDCISSSDILLSPGKLNDDEIMDMKSNSIFMGLLNPFTNREQFQQFKKRGNTAISMEFIPRITRAQKMDVLSSQSNLAGYVAVIESAKLLNAALPMMMTAAGTLKPANVFVIGVGVAGLQAIATAKRLGSQVEAFDVRPEVKEQVESLGAKFIEVDNESNEGVGSGGYASETSDEYKAKQQELMKERVGKSDIVITTALIPNKPAPMLIPKSMVETMAPGSVIMDLASENGGNCELTKENEIVNHNGVLIDGNSNLPSTMAYHSSQLFSKNIEAIIDHCHSEEGFKLDKEDEIIDGMLFIENGEIRHQQTKESM